MPAKAGISPLPVARVERGSRLRGRDGRGLMTDTRTCDRVERAATELIERLRAIIPPESDE